MISKNIPSAMHDKPSQETSRTQNLQGCRCNKEYSRGHTLGVIMCLDDRRKAEGRL